MELLTITGTDGYKLSAAVFRGNGSAATVQIVHGMEEHKERYFGFASFLSENGFNVVVTDLRGHGSSAPVLSHIADRKGDELLINDQQKVTSWIKENFPGLPLILFGHSMGTIISRVLLKTDSKEYVKAVLSGYVAPNPAGGVAVALGNTVKAFRGPKSHSKLLTTLAMGPFAKAVKDRKTDLDWLSYNEENVRKYMDDPLCGVEFSTGSYCALFSLLSGMAKAGEYRDVNADMPVLLIAGADDPCTGGEKGREASKALLESAGFKNITVITYDGMRHEILNETDKDKVMQDILGFMR